jgi:integrase
VKAAKERDKAYRLYDERGLYLEVSPAGGKLWRHKYRWGGKEKRLAFGAYPDVTLKDARERRDTARGQLAKGIDPAALDRAAKATRTGAGTFEAVAREWHAKEQSEWVESHAATTLRRLEANMFPWVGAKHVAEVEAPELLAALRRVEERGALETAHRILTICRQVFRYAIACGFTKVDPSASLRDALKSVVERHHASVTDPNKLRAVLRDMDGYRGTLVVRTALQLQALLFVRPGELRRMRWDDIDEAAAQWSFVASKTKTPLIVPLSKQAIALLRELRPLTGAGEFVFPSTRTGARPMSENTVNAALRRSGIDTKTELTGHGFRAAARTILDERLSFRPEVIELQLAHVVKDANGSAYNRTTHLAERTRMMQVWADFLDELRAAATTGAQ